MTPCGMNQITPTMIRNGQMNIGDKILFEDDIPVGAEISISAEPASSAVLSAAADAVETSAVSSEMTVEPLSEVSANIPLNAVISEAAEASAVTEISDAVEAAAITQLSESVSDTSELQPLSYGMSNVERSAASVQNSQGSQNSQSTQNGNAMQLWQSNPESATVQAPPPNWPNRPNPVYYDGENRNFITYPRMTDYFQDSVNTDVNSNTPNFTVPSNPMTPPEYTQTLDYDSVQYMNGFLRTQIGRFVRLEQLVGSNTIEDREGFLVGASNNYVVLQEIGTGNIMTFDLFSIKFVYIYYEDIPRPQSNSR